MLSFSLSLLCTRLCILFNRRLVTITKILHEVQGMSFFLSFGLVFWFFHLKTYIQLYTLFDNVVRMVWRKRNLLDATTWQWCGMLGLFCTQECAPILSTLDSKPCNSKNRLLRRASTFQFDCSHIYCTNHPATLSLYSEGNVPIQ